MNIIQNMLCLLNKHHGNKFFSSCSKQLKSGHESNYWDKELDPILLNLPKTITSIDGFKLWMKENTDKSVSEINSFVAIVSSRNLFNLNH